VIRVISNLVVTASQRAWLFLLAVLVAFVSLNAVFGPLGAVFAELTGGELMFDFQNRLTVDEMFEQLSVYTDSADQVYYAFSFVDFFFPFFAGLFQAAIAAFSLRVVHRGAYDWITARHLWALLMLATLFDWLENGFALAVISSYPRELVTAAQLMIWAKYAKLGFTLISMVIGFSLLTVAALKWLGLRLGIIRSTDGEHRA